MTLRNCLTVTLVINVIIKLHNRVILRDIFSQFKHKGIPCNQCDSPATQQGDLKRHIQSKHKGIPCNQCDSPATQQGHPQDHISAKHRDNILQCECCDFQIKWRF